MADSHEARGRSSDERVARAAGELTGVDATRDLDGSVVHDHRAGGSRAQVCPGRRRGWWRRVVRWRWLLLLGRRHLVLLGLLAAALVLRRGRFDLDRVHRGIAGVDAVGDREPDRALAARYAAAVGHGSKRTLVIA